MTETILVTLVVLLLASARSIIVRAGFIYGPVLIIIGLMAVGGIVELARLLS